MDRGQVFLRGPSLPPGLRCLSDLSSGHRGNRGTREASSGQCSPFGAPVTLNHGDDLSVVCTGGKAGWTATLRGQDTGKHSRVAFLGFQTASENIFQPDSLSPNALLGTPGPNDAPQSKKKVGILSAGSTRLWSTGGT